jgi:hypothetical protein
MSVKSSIVLSYLKTLGELITVQNLKPSTVTVHTFQFNVQVLGLVKISLISPLNILLLMIPMVMDPSI